MTLSVNAKTYTADSFRENAVGYTGPAHTVTTRDYVKLGRQAPVKSAQTSGIGRTDAKLTRTLTLTGAVTPVWDAGINVHVDIPVGAASADVDTLLNDMGAFVASAFFKTHVKSQIINA